MSISACLRACFRVLSAGNVCYPQCMYHEDEQSVSVSRANRRVVGKLL